MMTIGVTDTMGSEHKFQKYLMWLQRGNVALQCSTLSYKLKNMDAIEACDGLLLTGGHDVHPSLYHGPVGHPKIIDTDIMRDDFERKVLDRALERRLPILGICRGLQLTNVHLGGSLVPDLEEAGYRLHRCETWDCRHDIVIERDSGLFIATGRGEGNVNSSHHQGVDLPAPGLRVVARSEDGIVEAMEWNPSSALPFFQLVQYHPERMQDFENSLSKNILEKFLQSITSAIEQI
jgi:putative glutamine amidotransferase